MYVAILVVASNRVNRVLMMAIIMTVTAVCTDLANSETTAHLEIFIGMTLYHININSAQILIFVAAID